jgi:[ribosomal protein S18]-alanine N-acetyltransferase
MNKQEKHITDVQIRWLIKRDMPEVLEIENRSFSEPCPEKEFLRLLRQASVIGVVAEPKTFGAIYGFMIYELHKQKLNLLNFAVAPEVRGTGVGRAMVERLIDKLSQQRRRWITLEAYEENLTAQKFFSSCGFKAFGCAGGKIQFQYILPGDFPEWRCVNRITNHGN